MFGFVGLALVAAVLGLGLAHNVRCRRQPIMFSQATVVEVGEKTTVFALYGGERVELRVQDLCLHEGDYGRLTWQGKRCREFARM